MAILKTRRSGVALIVVLGLVAILMIVSVTFTIHMRVERAGAANLRHSVIARQIVKGGLAAALMAIDKQAGASTVPEWYDPDDPTSLTYRPFTKFRDGSAVHGYLWRDTFVIRHLLNRLFHEGRNTGLLAGDGCAAGSSAFLFIHEQLRRISCRSSEHRLLYLRLLIKFYMFDLCI